MIDVSTRKRPSFFPARKLAETEGGPSDAPSVETHAQLRETDAQ